MRTVPVVLSDEETAALEELAEKYKVSLKQLILKHIKNLVETENQWIRPLT